MTMLLAPSKAVLAGEKDKTSESGGKGGSDGKPTPDATPADATPRQTDVKAAAEAAPSGGASAGQADTAAPAAEAAPSQADEAAPSGDAKQRQPA